MGKYLLPKADTTTGDNWIECWTATSFTDAEERIARALAEQYDLPVGSTFEECVEILYEDSNYLIGEIYDIEEF